jgi:hypothetical protein
MMAVALLSLIRAEWRHSSLHVLDEQVDAYRRGRLATYSSPITNHFSLITFGLPTASISRLNLPTRSPVLVFAVDWV